MGKPQNKVKIKWSPNFAYAIGLLATDGSLSSNGRHIDFTSVDLEQINNFMRCLGIKNKIGSKSSAFSERRILRVQFGDINFCKFLNNIGITPKKSKSIGALGIPKKFFMDFLRGHFDGDGTFYSYWDPRWRSSFMFYTEFMSASKIHVEWIRSMLSEILGIKGHITKARTKGSVYQLKYAKAESLVLLPAMYYDNKIKRLSRKYLKIKKVLGIIGRQGLI